MLLANQEIYTCLFQERGDTHKIAQIQIGSNRYKARMQVLCHLNCQQIPAVYKHIEYIGQYRIGIENG